GGKVVHTTGAKGAFRVNHLVAPGECSFQVLCGAFPHASGLETLDVPLDSAGIDASPRIQGSGQRLPSKRLPFLELPDTRFRTDSCVVMADAEGTSENDAPDGASAPSTIAVLAAALRASDERPQFKLFIAGHTASVDTI